MNAAIERPRTTAEAAAWAMAHIGDESIPGDTRGEKIQGVLATYRHWFSPLTRADIYRLLPVVLMVAQEFLPYV